MDNPYNPYQIHLRHHHIHPVHPESGNVYMEGENPAKHYVSHIHSFRYYICTVESKAIVFLLPEVTCDAFCDHMDLKT